jgi:hypothetical protein
MKPSIRLRNAASHAPAPKFAFCLSQKILFIRLVPPAQDGFELTKEAPVGTTEVVP